MLILFVFVWLAFTSQILAATVIYQTDASTIPHALNYGSAIKSADLLNEIDDGSSKHKRKHIDHPVVLCWIETTTLIAEMDQVKEIYREFAISVEMESNFENFCFRYNNMYTTYYRDKQVALFQEVIQSEGPRKTTTKVKRFKCVQGTAFTKNFMSWTEDPRKRVQISNRPIHNVCGNKENDERDECSKILDDLTSTCDQPSNNNSDEYNIWNDNGSDKESKRDKIKWRMFSNLSKISLDHRETSTKQEDSRYMQHEDEDNPQDILTSANAQIEKPSKRRHDRDSESNDPKHQSMINENHKNFRRSFAKRFRPSHRLLSHLKPVNHNQLLDTSADLCNESNICREKVLPNSDGTQIFISEKNNNCCSFGSKGCSCQNKNINRFHDLLMTLKFNVNYEEDIGKAPIIKIKTQSVVEGKNGIIKPGQDSKIQKFLSEAFRSLGQQLSNKIFSGPSSPDMHINMNIDRETDVTSEYGQETGSWQRGSIEPAQNKNFVVSTANGKQTSKPNTSTYEKKASRPKIESTKVNNVNIGGNINYNKDTEYKIKNTIQDSRRKSYSVHADSNDHNYDVTENQSEDENVPLRNFEPGSLESNGNLDADHSKNKPHQRDSSRTLGHKTRVYNYSREKDGNIHYRQREDDHINADDDNYNYKPMKNNPQNENSPDKGSRHSYQNNYVQGANNFGTNEDRLEEAEPQDNTAYDNTMNQGQSKNNERNKFQQNMNMDNKKDTNNGSYDKRVKSTNLSNEDVKVKANDTKVIETQMKKDYNKQSDFRREKDKVEYEENVKHLNKATYSGYDEYSKNQMENEYDHSIGLNVGNIQDNTNQIVDIKKNYKQTKTQGRIYNSKDGVKNIHKVPSNIERFSSEDSYGYVNNNNKETNFVGSRPLYITPSNIRTNSQNNNLRRIDNENVILDDDHKETRNPEDIKENRHSNRRFKDIDHETPPRYSQSMNFAKHNREHQSGQRGVPSTEENSTGAILLNDQNDASGIDYSVGYDSIPASYDYDRDNDANGSLPRETYDSNVMPPPPRRPSLDTADRKHDNDSYNVPQNMLQRRPPNQQQPPHRISPHGEQDGDYNVPQNTSSRPSNLWPSRIVSTYDQ